jgi:hypothetical protein
MKIHCLVASALVICALNMGCAPATLQNQPETSGGRVSDATGEYRFTSKVQGRSFEGVIEIGQNSEGDYRGTVTTPLTGDLPIRSVAVTPEWIEVDARGPQGDATVHFQLSGPHLIGMWQYGSARGFMAGRQVSGPGLVERVEVPAAGETEVEYAGAYEVSSSGRRIRVEKDGTHLYAQAEGQPAFPLLYRGNHRFQAPARTGIEIVFEVSGTEAAGFELHQNGRVQHAQRIRE